MKEENSQVVERFNSTIEGLLIQYAKNNEPIEVSFRKLVPEFTKTDRATHLIHTYPAKLLMHINKLSKSDKIEFLEVFGMNESLFLRLRKNPNYIEYRRYLSQQEKNVVKTRKLDSIIAVEIDNFLSQSGILRGSARSLEINEDILLTISDGLQILRFSKF